MGYGVPECARESEVAPAGLVHREGIQAAGADRQLVRRPATGEWMLGGGGGVRDLREDMSHGLTVGPMSLGLSGQTSIIVIDIQ